MARHSALQGPLARYGRGSLVILLVIMAVGFGLRLEKVVNPLSEPGDDALAYRALAESLYLDGTYGPPGFTYRSDWSPGAPLIYAGAYYLTGKVRDGVARGVEALFGTAAILVVFLLTARIARPRDGPEPSPVAPGIQTAALLAAGMVAVYPPFIHSTGALMSEPPAIFTLPAAVLAFLWADSRGSPWAWIAPGLLFGATALIRPEYLAVAFAFGILLLVRLGLTRGLRKTLAGAVVFAAAVLIPIIPWTIHNYVTLDRVVPISTGSGKALFVGTSLPDDGEYQRVKASLLERYTGRELPPGSDALDRVDPVPLFDRAALRYPELTRDAALGKIGKENLNDYLGADPLGYLGMTVRKVGRMWGSGVGEAMSSPAGAAIQKLLVVLGVAGLVLLAWRRRWEGIAIATPIVTVTAVGAATLAPARRNEILMTLILPLAALALAEAGAWIARWHGTGPGKKTEQN
ncbi:MAG: phospholipid carrier-dependent glycosyltransferase [Thermoleophilia bacterium]|nr:phospholipid carrier-dependent glycosyltransferase [Thermoleophilia bacterium]